MCSCEHVTLSQQLLIPCVLVSMLHSVNNYSSHVFLYVSMLHSVNNYSSHVFL